jgi:hypothetical protein
VFACPSVFSVPVGGSFCNTVMSPSPTLQRSTYRARGLVVMIVACQVIDPGSIPGERTFFVLFFGFLVKKNPKNVENQGIDPCASCMLSMRSTI